MTLFSSVATLWRVLMDNLLRDIWNLARGNQAAFEEPIPARLTQPGGPVNPLYVTKLGRSIRREEDGLLITASFKVSLPQEARVYGYCYIARPETPFPTPAEFATIVRRHDPSLTDPQIQALYNDLLHYFGVSQRTFHVSWSLDPEGPFLVEKDLLLPPGVYTVYGQVLIPGWAIYNHIYAEIHSPLYDQDYYAFSCALSVAGTRDTQDVRAEAVQTVTIKELKDA